MGIFDEIDKAMKKVETEVKKADLDRHFRDIGDGLTKAGSGISREIDKACAPKTAQAAAPAQSRAPHPGYSRITAWVKTRYSSRIAGAKSDPYQTRLELEHVTAEATNGLPAKVKKGFLDYLKS